MKANETETGLSRRRFLRATGLGLLAAATGCGPVAPAPSPSSPPGSQSPNPGQRTWKWEIRYIKGTPRVDLATWRLRVDGLVEQPAQWSLDELQALPVTEQSSRMKCVECWSGPALWRGVAGRDLLAQVRPLSKASHVRLYALDGYDTTLPLPVVMAPRSIFVYAMDGGPLPPDNGAPLRLIVPSLYGYKNCKGIERVEVTDRPVPGYWERAGYPDDGTIRAGTDHPLDLGVTRPIIGGEITDY